MLLYLTIFLASFIGFIGILVKTKEEVKGSGLYKLTKGGWILILSILLLLIFNITIQYQRDRMQQLQEQSAFNKRRADSLLQANQRQQLELLLQQQVQKNNIDSFHYLAESSKTDNLLSTQQQALSDQRLNNNYLRKQLDKQEQVNNAVTHKLDTLWLNAVVDLQLTPEWTEKLKPFKYDHLDQSFFGTVIDRHFLKTSFQVAPSIYDLLKDMEIDFMSPPNRVFYEFGLFNYMDTTMNKYEFNGPIFINMYKPSFTLLEYNFGTGELTLKIHKIKSLSYNGDFIASLTDFCKNNVDCLMVFRQDSSNKIISTASLRSASLYKSRTKNVYLEKIEKPESYYHTYSDNGVKYTELQINQTAHTSCSFE
jgi:hypothetical protein